MSGSKIRLYGSTSGYVELEAPAVSPDASLVLPSTFAGVGSNVVQAVKTDVFTTTSGTYVDITGLSVTITPSSATSKILIIGSLQYSASLIGDDSSVWRITGGNADTFVGDAAGTRPRSVGSLGIFSTTFNSALMMLPGPVAYVDSPATASPVTYKMQALTTGGQTMSVNRTGTDTDGLYGRGASSLIAIEVAA